MSEPDLSLVYDYVVIGSGFGGAVSALRLTEKGYRVLIIEQGRRKKSSDFPRTNWDVRKYLWAPLLRCFGIQKISFFNEAFVLSGVGYGGGSLVYANTHMMPASRFFQDAIWSHLQDWESALKPHYERARQMLGTTKNPHLGVEDQALKAVAEKWGRGNSFSSVDVGIYFGDPNQSVDPYFNGEGPLRKGCILCSGCMIGCRHDAKNTLDKNYLYLAEKRGAQVLTGIKIEKIEFDSDIYTVSGQSPESLHQRNEVQVKAKGVVLAAGVLGTLEILFKQKWKYKTLPKLSERLGEKFRTNSESLCGVAGSDIKLNNGIAISSVIHPDDNTHIQICKYPNGSGLMGKLGTAPAGAGGIVSRGIQSGIYFLRHPWPYLKLMLNFEIASKAIFLLVMQNLDNSMKMVFKRGFFGWRLKMQNGSGERVPSFIATGQGVMHDYAESVNGIPMNAIPEIFFNLSTTAHVLGGCPMGSTVQEGVVDSKFNVFGYPRMLITDGSIIPCNLGVNPSLTITALSEYAMAQILPKSERPLEGF